MTDTDNSPRRRRLWRRIQTYRRDDNPVAARALLESLTRAQPDDTEAWLALSAVALQSERLRDSVKAAKLASKAVVKGARWDLMIHVAMPLVTLGEYQALLEMLRAAPRTEPELLRHAEGVSQYLGLADQHREALEWVDAGFAARGANPGLLFARATCLRHLGRLEEATADYERCIAMDPSHAEAHWSLAYHQPSSPPGHRVDRLRRVLATLPADSPSLPFLHYALFKEYDDAGETSAAWRHLRKGMRAKRSRLRINSVHAAARYDKLMKHCDEEFLNAPARSVPGGHKPIFIVGLPRTGTTLLERMLGQHSRIDTAGELGDFHMQLCLETDTMALNLADEKLLERQHAVDWERLGDDYLARTAWRTAPDRCLIDKLPGNFDYSGYIRKALPQARILCMMRDPMDACFSNIKELFSGNHNPYSYDLTEMAGRYQQFEKLLTHWQRTLPEHFHMIEYERIVADPETELRKVLAFCGLPFEAGCLDIVANKSPSSTASASQIRQPIHARSVGAWKRYEGPLEPVRALLNP